MVIRQERTEEFPQIYDLVKVAFQTAKVSNGKEQDFVNQLRSGGSYIPELTLIAEENGKLVGHIMLSKAHIVNGADKFEVIYVAPLSVVLEHRNKGIGSSLIKESFRLAKEMGYTSVLLVGDPAYYHRFGFKSAVTFGIKPTHEIPDENVMACELVPNALKGVSGTTDCF
ncbi:MAG: N-acetyltransferase [Chloroflexi bacterium]|nr:N-acetyltransferase [Chloroflexota bacterium]